LAPIIAGSFVHTQNPRLIITSVFVFAFFAHAEICLKRFQTGSTCGLGQIR
jgi:hypothetical protein